MNNHRYSLTSSPESAITIDRDGYGTSIPVQPAGFTPGDMRGASVLPPSVESPKVPPGQRPYFISQPHWNEALDGPRRHMRTASSTP